MSKLKTLNNVDAGLSFNLNPCLNILGLNPEKARADIMRKVGQETTKRNLQGVIYSSKI